MLRRITRALLRPIPYVFTDRGGLLLTSVGTRSLKEQLRGKVTDTFLELLLRGMDLAFTLMRGFRRNIANFDGRYLFITSDGLVATAATFGNGNMSVKPDSIDDWDVRVTFKDASALQRFFFSRNQDVLDSILRNEVEVDGNLNLIYKFAFMARDLSRRLGVL